MAKDGIALALDSAQLVSTMFALIPVPVAITDDRGRVVIANSSFTDVFQGVSTVSALPQQELQVANRGTFRVQTLPLNDEGYKIVYATEIGDEVQLRKQVSHLEKMAAIGRVVTGVAHELSGPLSEISSYAPMAERCNLAGEAKQIVGAVFTKAERASSLVQNLLVLAGITAPKHVPFDLNGIVRTIVESRGRRQRIGNFDISLDLDPNLPKAVGDPAQIEQVLATLLVNAEDSVSGVQRRPGSIQVRTCVRTGRIQVHVSDNGIGRDAARVFEPNENGVGLNICAEIVKDHGGELYAWSSYGSGATLTLELPVCMQDSSEMGSAGRHLQGKNMLVVDDEVHITEFVYDALTRNGAHVQIANSGSEAYELLRTRHFDLVLCDQNMPGLSGQSLYRLVEGSNPEGSPQFLFITGDILAAEARLFFSQTGVSFLKKPFRTQELIEAVNRMFDGPRQDS
jgi:signal transduction histidine kinase/ActR/RegA family two-component response regulator